MRFISNIIEPPSSFRFVPYQSNSEKYKYAWQSEVAGITLRSNYPDFLGCPGIVSLKTQLGRNRERTAAYPSSLTISWDPLGTRDITGMPTREFVWGVQTGRFFSQERASFACCVWSIEKAYWLAIIII